MEIPIFLFIPLLSGCAPISPLYPPIPFQLFRPVCRFSLVSCEVLAQCSPPSLLELLPHFPARLWGLTSPPPLAVGPLRSNFFLPVLAALYLYYFRVYVLPSFLLCRVPTSKFGVRVVLSGSLVLSRIPQMCRFSSSISRILSLKVGEFSRRCHVSSLLSTCHSPLSRVSCVFIYLPSTRVVVLSVSMVSFLFYLFVCLFPKTREELALPL